MPMKKYKLMFFHAADFIVNQEQYFFNYLNKIL